MPTRMIERSAQGRNTPCDVGVAKTAPLRIPYIYIYTYIYIYIDIYINNRPVTELLFFVRAGTQQK